MEEEPVERLRRICKIRGKPGENGMKPLGKYFKKKGVVSIFSAAERYVGQGGVYLGFFCLRYKGTRVCLGE